MQGFCVDKMLWHPTAVLTASAFLCGSKSASPNQFVQKHTLQQANPALHEHERCGFSLKKTELLWKMNWQHWKAITPESEKFLNHPRRDSKRQKGYDFIVIREEPLKRDRLRHCFSLSAWNGKLQMTLIKDKSSRFNTVWTMRHWFQTLL